MILAMVGKTVEMVCMLLGYLVAQKKEHRVEFSGRA